MGIDARNERFCDDCGRVMVKAHRVCERGEFCASCYPRLFPVRPCSSCGGTARSHKDEATAICGACMRSQRTCQRCDKALPKAGMRVGAGYVCAACVPNFLPKRPCSRCGKETSRLTQSAGGGGLVCESCRTAGTHATCTYCRRHRKIAHRSAEHGVRCAACLPGHEVSHACPDCAARVPGPGLGRCISCINRSSASRHVELTLAALSQDWTRELWRKFSQWLIDRYAHHPKILGLVVRYDELFRELDVRFESHSVIESGQIEVLLGPGFLRRFELFKRYLAQAGASRATVQQREASSEQQRLIALMMQIDELPAARKVLRGYADHLTRSEVAPRTARMYLRTALEFCRQACAHGALPPPTGEAIAFIEKAPGLVANLSRFVTYVNSAYAWRLQRPQKRPTRAQPRTVTRLRESLESVQKAGLEACSTHDLVRILAISLGLRIPQVQGARWSEAAENLVCEVGEERINVPGDLQGFARALRGRSAQGA